MLGDGTGMGLGDGYMWLIWLSFGGVFAWVVRGLLKEVRGAGSHSERSLKERCLPGEPTSGKFQEKNRQRPDSERR